MSIEDYLSSAEYVALVEDWNKRMMAFDESAIENEPADDTYEMSDEEVAEYASLLDEYFFLLKLKLVYSTIKDGVETPYSTAEFIKMSELMDQEEIPDVDYKIAFYNDESVLLADFVITKDLFNSSYEEDEDGDINDVEDDGDVLNLIEDISKATISDLDKNNDLVQTVKGGKLPTTATNYISSVLMGLFITLSGIMILQKTRTDKIEIL